LNFFKWCGLLYRECIDILFAREQKFRRLIHILLLPCYVRRWEIQIYFQKNIVNLVFIILYRDYIDSNLNLYPNTKFFDSKISLFNILILIIDCLSCKSNVGTFLLFFFFFFIFFVWVIVLIFIIFFFFFFFHGILYNIFKKVNN